MLEGLHNSAWAIRHDLAPMVAAWVQKSAAGKLDPPKPNAGPSYATDVPGTIAVIGLQGVITPNGSFLSRIFGFPSGLNAFRSALRSAVSDSDVSKIILDVNSPGGLVDLVPETAAEIRAARDEKEIIAVVNTQSASAAYWLTAQASEIVVTPSGELGSIGVFMMHNDWSSWNEKFGVDPTYVFAGEHKVEGNPDEPLSDEARAHMQAGVDRYYEMFTSDVAEGRGVSADVVKADYGKGRVLMASDAVSLGMADRIGTLEEVIAEALGSKSVAERVAKAISASKETAGVQASDDENAEPAPEVPAEDEEDTEDSPEAITQLSPPDPSPAEAADTGDDEETRRRLIDVALG